MGATVSELSFTKTWPENNPEAPGQLAFQTAGPVGKPLMLRISAAADDSHDDQGKNTRCTRWFSMMHHAVWFCLDAVDSSEIRGCFSASWAVLKIVVHEEGWLLPDQVLPTTEVCSRERAGGALASAAISSARAC